MPDFAHMTIPEAIATIAKWAGWGFALWRLNGLYSVTRVRSAQHRIMWKFTARKAGLPESADPIDVEAALALRYATTKVAHGASAGKTH